MTRRIILLTIVLGTAAALSAMLGPGLCSSQPGAPVLDLTVVRTLPHDPNAFTQGLFLHRGVLYESTGRYGHSRIRAVVPQTGQVFHEALLGANLFGEGLALVENRAVQLTWKAGRAFVYDLDTLEIEREFAYRGQGWGLAYGNGELWMSDGSDMLVRRDPETFEVLGEVAVTDRGRPVKALNELEWVNGFLLANIWLTDRVAIIDPATGRVVAWLDLSALKDRAGPGSDVTNGLAWDAAHNLLLATGKLWHSVFAIRVLNPPWTTTGTGQ